MNNGKYTGIEEIILSVYRDMGVADQINIGDAVEWAGEVIEIIKPPYHLEEKVGVVLVDNYRSNIPCDLHYIETVKGVIRKDAADIEECEIPKNSFIPMRYTTDAFHMYCSKTNDHQCVSSLTYKVNNNYIFSNFETGFLAISYQAIPVDDNGYPKIPDDIKFKLAVRYHIMMKLAFIKFMQGKISERAYQKIEQDRDFYIGAAETRSQMPSIDMMESIKNNWIRLIPKINQHQDGFRNSGDPEQRHLHNAGSFNRSSSTSSNTYFYRR